MIIEHQFSGLRTIGDMKRAIEASERLGYTDDAVIKPQIFFTSEADTYRFSQDVNTLRTIPSE